MSLVSSHQRLDMDGQKTSPRFERKKGVFVERWVILLVLFLAACAVVAVGLLVAYLGPCSSQQSSTVTDGSIATSKGGSTAQTGGVGGGTSKTQSGDKVTTPSTDGDASKTEKLTDLRLPRSIVPDHYTVQLQPYIMPGNFTFDGTMDVIVDCTEDTDNITIHFLNMTIYNESVALAALGSDGNPVSNLTVGKIAVDEKRQFYIMYPKEKLKKDAKYKLSMRFTGILNDILAGFYRSSYKDNGTDKWLAITQFEPTDARRAFPCFDEPALKATFDITIVKWKNMSAISNMPPLNTVSRDADWEAVTFDTTPRMSTYLLAFVVSEFANITNKSSDGRTFSVWSVPSAINTTLYALGIGPPILQHYDIFFETPYPLNKTDLVAVPDFNAGAMENWGLITFRETAMLYDKLTSSSMNKQSICQTVAHELAHQWFGNLVTPAWWDDLWLNEGFASYMEYLGCSFVEPTWGMDQQSVIDHVQTAMHLDALNSTHPIYVPVNNPAEINEIFDIISYDKGASIIRMMDNFIGNATFQLGLKNYLQANAYQSATSTDLWNALSETYNNVTTGHTLDVAAIMNTWTTQKGFPVVNVTRDYNQRSATVTQKIFQIDQSNGSSDNTLWQIPLTWSDNNTDQSLWNTTTNLWFDTSSVNINNLSDANTWVIFNIQEVGFYKVNYDIENWRRLIDQLNNNHSKIHVINRAQILDDVFDLARAYAVNYTLAMNTTLYLSQEQDYVPWAAGLGSLSYLSSMLRRSDAYGNWMAYIIKLLVPNYNRLGWTEDVDHEPVLTQYLRISTLSNLCGYDYQPCVDNAVQMFNTWKQDPNNNTIIPPNFRNLVYCTAIRHSSNSSDWDFMWQRYLNESISSERSKIMSALACTDELWLLSKYLRLSLDNNSPIRKQDATTVFSSVARNNYGRDIAFNMMRDKWDVLFNNFGTTTFSFGDLVKSVTSSMNTQFELKQLKDFKNGMSEDQLGTANRAFNQAIEVVESNVKFMRDHYPTIASWLNSTQL